MMRNGTFLEDLFQFETAKKLERKLQAINSRFFVWLMDNIGTGQLAVMGGPLCIASVERSLFPNTEDRGVRVRSVSYQSLGWGSSTPIPEEDYDKMLEEIETFLEEFRIA
jgi:hypothetical protein